MPMIEVRDVPNHIYRRLVEEATLANRSLEQQMVETLARGLNVKVDPKRDRLETLARIRARGPIELPLDTVALIREDRSR